MLPWLVSLLSTHIRLNSSSVQHSQVPLEDSYSASTCITALCFSGCLCGFSRLLTATVATSSPGAPTDSSLSPPPHNTTIFITHTISAITRLFSAFGTLSSDKITSSISTLKRKRSSKIRKPPRSCDHQTLEKANEFQDVTINKHVYQFTLLSHLA